MFSKLRYFIPIAAIFLIIVAFALSGGTKPQSLSSKDAEKTFIEQMIPHHESAIAMAEQAGEQAERAETKVLATNIISSQKKEIADMQKWYRQWFGVDVPKVEVNPHGGHAPEPENGTATTFDQAFVAMMIPHHESAVKMAKEVQKQAFHSEIKSLAAAIIKDQNSEITLMKKYKLEWKEQSSTNKSVTILYLDNGFDQPNLTIEQGTTVTWINKRTEVGRPMWVASNVHPEHFIYPEFDQVRLLGYEPLPKDNMYSFTFDKIGTWEYHDHFDPEKKGIIKVL